MTSVEVKEGRRRGGYILLYGVRHIYFSNIKNKSTYLFNIFFFNYLIKQFTGFDIEIFKIVIRKYSVTPISYYKYFVHRLCRQQHCNNLFKPKSLITYLRNTMTEVTSIFTS